MAIGDAVVLDVLRARLHAIAPSCPPFGTLVHVFAEVDSTNDVAHALAHDGAPEGTVVVAGLQRRGRGRRGTPFHSPGGSGLYCSTLLRPPSWPGTPAARTAGAAMITLMAGVAVADTAHALGASAAELKWPNDVVVPDGASRLRKLAGVLTEGAADTRGLHHVVLGIGLNVTAVPQGVGLDRSAIALAECVPDVPSLPDVAVTLFTRLSGWLQRLQDHGPAAIVDAWRTFAPSLAGRRVSWRDHGLRLSGIVRGIDETGALEVERGTALTRLTAGAVEWDGYGA